MRKHKAKSPYGGKVTIWAREDGQEPRYLEFPTGATIFVEVGKAGPLAVPCEYRRTRPLYKAMISLEDLDPQLACVQKGAKAGTLRVSRRNGTSGKEEER